MGTAEEKEEFFRQKVGEYLEENFEASYGYEVEIDEDKEIITLYTTRSKSADIPLIGSIVDELLEENGMGNYDFKADHDSTQF